MKKYKLFKSTENYIKFLTPLNPNSKFKVAKVISEANNMGIGYSEDGIMFFEIDFCPKIFIDTSLTLKNIELNKYENVGKLVDIQWDESSGYLFIFE